MLFTTKGIVLHHFKYSEKSVIAKIYTEKFGIQSYILNGVRSAKSKNKAVYLQPLSLVEINANHKEKKGLQQVKNIQLAYAYTSIPFEIAKTSIAFFIAEILYKSIKEEEANIPLFEFLFNTLQILDLQESNCANFHIIFMAQLSYFLGISPQNKNIESSTIYFDLQEGMFLSVKPPHQAHIAPPLSNLLITILNANYNSNNLLLSYTDRKKLLAVFLDYYGLHLSNFENLKSLSVLEEVLS
jgi:DNA repair protein RecO (recombination protein O)